jgi:hypothetical protein
MRMEPNNFYRHCASRAWHASTQFANNWTWSLGIPILAAAVTYLGMAEADNWRWAFLVSLFIGLGAFAFTWCISFVVCFFRAGPKLYYEERNRADILAERLTPKIGLDVEGANRGVRKEETWDNAANMAGPLIMWVQFAVTPIGDAPLIDCEARLVRVTRLEEGKDEVILEEPVFCIWSNTEKTSLKIPAGITNYANLFSVFLDRKVPLPVTSPRKVGLERQIRLPGLYRLEVSVSARDVPTRTATFLFIWDGRPENLALRMESSPAALSAH